MNTVAERQDSWTWFKQETLLSSFYTIVHGLLHYLIGYYYYNFGTGAFLGTVYNGMWKLSLSISV